MEVLLQVSKVLFFFPEYVPLGSNNLILFVILFFLSHTQTFKVTKMIYDEGYLKLWPVFQKQVKLHFNP